jgi:hypothetical protein
VRSTVRTVRVPEPVVGAAVPAEAPPLDLAGVASFTLTYPEGSYDTETLHLDPLTSNVLILTKQNGAGRLYRANLSAAANGTTVGLTFVMTVAFGDASGGDIAPDGSQITLRREDAAMIWNRTGDEPLETALARTGAAVAVIGAPVEPNGEAMQNNWKFVVERQGETVVDGPRWSPPAKAETTPHGKSLKGCLIPAWAIGPGIRLCQELRAESPAFRFGTERWSGHSVPPAGCAACFLGRWPRLGWSGP